jgi:hypothetical protein
VYAARFLKTLVNQIKVNEFVPFDMVISVSISTVSLRVLFVSLQMQSERERERKRERRTHVLGSSAFLEKTVLIDNYYELKLRN